jgi:hypothetical protein
VPLHTLIRVAGTRWNVETCFRPGESIGLGEPQVRRWNSWYGTDVQRDPRAGGQPLSMERIWNTHRS